MPYLCIYIYTIYIYILFTSFICVSMWFMVYWSFWSATKARHGSTEISTVVVRFYTGVRCFKSQALRFFIVKRNHKNLIFPKMLKILIKFQCFPKMFPMLFDL